MANLAELSLNQCVLVDFITTREYLLAPNALDADIIDERKTLLSELDALAAALVDMQRMTNDALDRAHAAQAADAKTAETVLTKLGGKIDRSTPWLTRNRKCSRLTRTHAVSDLGVPMTPITESLGLPATVVQSFDAVKQDGNLYWVEPADHFAIRVAGMLLHGNIGTVYTDANAPEKIRDCRYTTRCGSGPCDYYHDPTIFPGSKDRRNFVASSWLYSPPANRARCRGRRFGSRDNLDYDIAGVQPDEVARQRDQCMHDLLCALLLRQYGRS